MNKTFIDSAPRVTKGYQGFPLDHLVNFTSVCGYVIPVFKQILDPGDKVTIKTLLRTRTQPFTKPAMATIIERIEWFAVPIEQLYKAFSPKFFGVNDVETDMYPQTFQDDRLPYIPLQTINNWMRSLPTTFEAQAAVPTSLPTFSEAKRLCDALGYPMKLGLSTTDGDGNDKEWAHSVSALFPAAYQKIWYDHYRLTDRVVNDPAAYNLDSFYNSTLVSNTNERLHKLLRLRKRPYQRDYFTSMDTSPLFGIGSVNSSSIDLGQVNQWLSGLATVNTGSPLQSSNFPNGGVLGPENGNPTQVRIGTSLAGSGTANQGQLNQVLSTVSPANLRSLFAVEKLLQVTRKAKKHYDKQVLAHFGVSVPKGLAGECFKLGTHEQYIQIGDVTATATVDGGSALGQLAGTGASKGSSKPIHFEAKCHCILMGVYSAEPLMNYPNTGLDRLNTMVRTSDFYKSEFDDLGQQPIFRFELFDNARDVVMNPTEFDEVIGWQDRYSQLKAAYNRSFAGCATQYFKEWSLNRNINENTYASTSFFEVWPTDINNILQVPFTGAIPPITSEVVNEAVYAEDYFISQLYLDVVKVSKKSIHGTPNLG